MNKILVISLCVLMQFGCFVAKVDQPLKLKVSFITKELSGPTTDLEYQESMILITDFLAQMAKKSKNQILTFEEIVTIYKMIMFLYLQDSDDYSKCIEIVLGNGEKFKIPYNHDILERLMIDQNSTNPQE